MTSDDDDVVTLSRMTVHGGVRLSALAGQSTTVLIEHTAVHSGDTPTVAGIGYDNVTVGIAASQLDGDDVVVGAASTMVCAGVWDETGALYSGACP